MNFPSQGKLQEGVFTNILLHIHASRFTGTVGLSRKDLKKVISFSGGRPVSSRSNVVKESLGGMLVAKGRITESDRKQILGEHKDKPDRKIGELLVSKKFLTNFELDGLLKEQLVERIKGSLFWDDGEYKIVEGKIAEKSQITLDEALPEIVYHSLRGNFDLKNLKDILPADIKPARAGETLIALEEVRLSGKEMALCKFIDGRSSIQKIIEVSGVDEKLGYSFIHTLVQMGFLNVKTERAHSRNRAESTVTTVPVMGSGGETLSPDSKRLVGLIMGKLKDIQGKNYFEYFGLDRNAAVNEVKLQYFNYAKSHHPDRLPRDFTPQMKKKGEELFAKLTEAYNVLMDEGKKKQYLEKLDFESKGIAQSPDQILESEIEFQKGQILVKKGDFDEAIKLITRSIALYPKEPEYYIGLSWAYFRKGAKTKDSRLIAKAKVELEKVIDRDSQNDKAYLHLGHVVKFEGNVGKAKEFYSKAVQINPNNLEASSELRLLTSREEKAKKGGIKGIFDKN